MLVSREKTVFISNKDDGKWPYLLLDGPHDDLNVVAQARYLGINVSSCAEMMKLTFNQRLRAVCSSYVKTIMSYAGSKYSIIQSCLTLWNGMAVPLMLYSTEVLNVSVELFGSPAVEAG